MNILYDKFRVAPLPVCRIAFVNIIPDKLRVASPKSFKN